MEYYTTDFDFFINHKEQLIIPEMVSSNSFDDS